MRRIALCILALALPALAALAAPDPGDILTKALNRSKGVKDYIATVVVDTDIPEIDIPTRKVTVYVKRPDKVYIDSKGFVLIPKRALLFGDIAKDIEKDTKIILNGVKTVDGEKIYCLKLMPKEDEDGPGEPRVLVWVNGARWTVERLQMMEGATVMASVKLTYVKSGGFWMPAKVACAIPMGTMGSDKPGHLSITFSDYKVNTGLTDEFFEKKERGR